jgi:hypothetical protein
MKDLPRARARLCRPGRGQWYIGPWSKYSFQTVAHFAWSDDCLFLVFWLVTVGNRRQLLCPLSVMGRWFPVFMHEHAYKNGHYRNLRLRRVLGALPSAFCWALDKEAFAE